MFLQILFWLSVYGILHTYLFYPALLKWLAKDKSLSKVKVSSEEFPFISIIIAAYNEDLVIEDKLNSIINSNYDHSKMEVLVGSDGSTDRTDEIVKGIHNEHPFISLHRFERSGKTGVLNQLTPKAKSNIIIYTDANVIFDEQCLRRLVVNFDDAQIGLVGANITSIDQLNNKGISFQEEKYIERENMIKFREGVLWGAMMGAFGGCYAMRKNLFKAIPNNFIVDDFYLSMHVLLAGFNSILALDAVCYEEVSVKESEEFRRKVRMSSGNFQNLFRFLPMIWARKFTIGFSFISHKILRWITPVFLIIIFITSLLLINVHWIYQLAWYTQLILLLIPILNVGLRQMNMRSKLIQFISYFYFMNLALFIGMLKYFSGINSATWEPTERKPGR